MGKFGIHTCFMVFAGIYATAFIPTLLIPAGLLGTKYSALRKGSSSSSGSGGSEAAAVPGGRASVDEATPEEKLPAPAAAGSAPGAAVAVDAGGPDPQQQTSAQSALSIANRRRSRRSEPHPPGQPGRRSTAHSDASGRQSGVHIVADARGGDGQGSRGDEVIVAITIRPASAKGVAGQSKGGAEEGGEDKDACGGGVAAEQENLWRDLGRFLADVYVLTFMFKAFLMGVANGFIGYLFLLLSDQGACSACTLASAPTHRLPCPSAISMFNCRPPAARAAQLGAAGRAAAAPVC